jgi:hypothetical protein
VLKNEYVRNGKNQIIGRQTTGSSNGDTVARDANGNILGRANSKFGITRDSAGRITSTNQGDADSLFDWDR